ncbi:MAG TPA: hypothetical protein PLP05_09380 [Sedimentisphaerales bacterium]|nr:hypothetical protein [Sedimentisphaerales bacterium]
MATAFGVLGTPRICVTINGKQTCAKYYGGSPIKSVAPAVPAKVKVDAPVTSCMRVVNSQGVTVNRCCTETPI